MQEGDPCVYVTNIIPGGAADLSGSLRVGDKVSRKCKVLILLEMRGYIKVCGETRRRGENWWERRGRKKVLYLEKMYMHILF